MRTRVYLKDIVGKAVESLHHIYYDAVVFTFTDGTFIMLSATADYDGSRQIVDNAYNSKNEFIQNVSNKIAVELDIFTQNEVDEYHTSAEVKREKERLDQLRAQYEHLKKLFGSS